MKGLIISGHRRGSLIDLWIRTETNQKQHIVINDFKPYFYYQSEYGEYKSIYGESLTKIYTKDPSQVRIERSKYSKTWEADIPYVRRAMIDLGLYKGIEYQDEQIYLSHKDIKPYDVNIKPLVLYLDIEITPAKDGFPNPEKAEYPVVSFSFKTNRNNTYFTYIYKEGDEVKRVKYDNWIVSYLDNEEKLLYMLIEVIDNIKPDIVTGWNIVDFDMTYLRNRFAKLNLESIDERSFEIFDLLAAYKKIFSQSSYALKRVAEIEEIARHEDVESFKDVSCYYKTDIKKFANYNKKDVEYVSEIDKKHSLIEYFLNFKWLVGLEDIQKTTVNSILIDTLLLRIAKEKGICLPSKVKRDEGEKYEGAYVMVEKAGLYDSVGVFDFKSYYPYLILSFNLSPENNGTEKDGIISDLLKRMLIEKENITEYMKVSVPGSYEYKLLKIRKEAVKRVINAVYGIMGYSGFRLYKPEIPAKITELGREGIKYLISLGEKYNYKVLLADTDSVFIQTPLDIAESLCKTLNNEVNMYFSNKYNVNMQLSLEFEKYINKLLLTGVKKRYAMRIIYNNGECDYIDTKGFEDVRSDQSIFTRKLLTELFKLILYGGEKNIIKNFVMNKLNEFGTKPLSEIAISKGISKPFGEYKVNSAHIRGAIYSNTYLNTNFKSGDKVQMLWLKGIEGLPQTDIICFNEDTDLSCYNLNIDFERMGRLNIIDKVLPILTAVGIDLENKGRQITFEY